MPPPSGTPTPTPPASVRSRSWRQRLQRWFWARLPQSDHTQLQQRNLYILPTGAGWLLLATLLALLIASINYQLNLGYLLTFLIAGCAFISVPMTHNTLRGLQLHIRPPVPQFANQPVLLDIHLHNPGKRQRLGVGLRLAEIGLADVNAAPASAPAATGAPAMIWCDCPAQSGQTVQLAWSNSRRGWHALPTIHIETRFPMGIFRGWSIWRTASCVLLYPAPETPAPPLPLQYDSPLPVNESMPLQPATGKRSDDLPEDIRPYQRGDALRSIVWKKAAQTGELIIRENNQPFSNDLWLHFDAADPQRGHEAALSRLCAWVQQASAQDMRFGLHLPATAHQAATTLGPDAGAAHAQRCLQALAEWGLAKPASAPAGKTP